MIYDGSSSGMVRPDLRLGLSAVDREFGKDDGQVVFARSPVRLQVEEWMTAPSCKAVWDGNGYGIKYGPTKGRLVT